MKREKKNQPEVATLKEIGSRLKAARERLKRPAVQVAAEVGTSQTTFSRWESAEVQGGCREVTQAGLLLGLSPDQLFLKDAASAIRDPLTPEEDKALSQLMVELYLLREACKGADESAIQVFADHLARLNTVLRQGTALPFGTTIRKPEPGVKTYDAPAAADDPTPPARASTAGDEAAPYGAKTKIVPIEHRPKKTNLRERLTIFTAHREPKPNAVRIEGWKGLAAGQGRDIERADDPLYIEGIRKASMKYFVIRGDSMEDSFLDNEIVLVKDLGPQGLTLPSLSKTASKTPLDAVRRQVPDDAVCILSINEEELTVKRVRYAAPTSKADWTLMLLADNPAHRDYPRPTSREDTVTFWAVVEGLAKPVLED